MATLRRTLNITRQKISRVFIESRIKQIEGKLSNTQIVDVTTIDAKGKNCFWRNQSICWTCSWKNRLPTK